MQAQKSMTLHWRSFLGGSSDTIIRIFAYKGSRYYNYRCMPLHSPWIILDAWQKIVDTHMKEVVGMWSVAFLPIKAANTVIMA